MRELRTKAAFAFIFLFYWIESWKLGIPLTGDQKLYLSMALEMKERREWFIPYLFGEPNFNKPPLQYWMTIAGWKLFGLSVFGFVLPAILAMLASAYFVKKIYELVWKENGDGPAILFAGTVGSMIYGSVAQMEIWILLFYLATWYFYLKNAQKIFPLSLGILTWVKGPLYPALWVISAQGFRMKTLSRVKWFEKKWMVGLLVAAVIGLSWFGIATIHFGEQLKNGFFGQENFSKLSGNSSSPFVLWREYFVSLFPWVFIAWTSFRISNRNFQAAYFLAPALFFTFFPYRVGTYLYPLTPWFAWAVWANRNYFLTGRKISAGVAFAFFAALSFLGFRLAQGSWISFSILIPICILSIVLPIFIWKNDLMKIAIVSVMMVSLIRVGAIEIGAKENSSLQLMVAQHTPVSVGYLIEEKDQWHEFGLLSALLERPVQRLFTLTQAIDFLDHRGMLISTPEQASQILAQSISKQSNSNQCIEWPRIKRRLSFPLKKLFTQGLAYGDPEVMRTLSLCFLK